MGTIIQDPVEGFNGENRLVPNGLLPPMISPDAQNNDYSRASILLRSGFTRLHERSIKEGGAHLDNSGSDNNCVYIRNHSDYIFTGDFTIEFSFMFLELPTANADLVTMFETGVGGWDVQYIQSTNTLLARIVDSGGTTRSIAHVAGSPTIEAGTIYHISFRRGEGGTDELRLSVNGVESNSVAEHPGMGSTSRDLYVGAGAGATPANQTLNYIVDEIRLWNIYTYPIDVVFFLGRRGREMNDTERTSLVGYWRLNEAKWFLCDDLSTNLNHGSFDGTAGTNNGFAMVSGLLPDDSEDGYAVRFDGREGFAFADGISGADYDTAVNTGNTWTLEGWLRLDSGNTSGNERAVVVGYSNENKLVDIYVDSSLNLFFGYSTTTTHSNATNDTTYNVVVGTAFHLALVRDGDTIRTYIDGVLTDTLTGVTSENGPNCSDIVSFGVQLNAAGARTNFGPYTLDDWRFWDSARSNAQIQEWMDRELTDVKNANLLGYWRFNAKDPEFDESTKENPVSSLQGAPFTIKNTFWARGLVYPQTSPKLLLVAPFGQPQRSDRVLSGDNPFRRELLVATHTDLWGLQNTTATQLLESAPLGPVHEVSLPGGTSLYDWVHFRGKVIFCNGQEPNRKYDGSERPQVLTIATPSSGVATATGAGASWPLADGEYKYRYSHRNAKDGTESLAGDEFSDTVVGATHDTIELTGLDTANDTTADGGQVTHKRIYRKNPGGAEFRFLADIADSATAYSDTGTVNTNNAIINDDRGHVEPYRYAVEHLNRLFLLNTAVGPSQFAYSEADTEDFPGVNIELVEADDGDELTGGVSAFGGLIFFKRFSVHFMSGEGPSTFSVRPIIPWQGCVNAQTIAESKEGIYYLSHDGVYRLGPDFKLEYMSHNEQTEFATADPDLLRLATGAYDPETHQYVVSLDLAEGRRTFAYDEESKSWAKWDVAFDYLIAAEHSTSQRELLGAFNGFVVRLFDGTTDASKMDGVAEGTLTGSVDITATATFEDVGATFPTTGDGLRGVPILLRPTSGADVWRTIIGNDATNLYLDTSATVDGTYYVGAIDWFWESPWMDMGKDRRARIKRWFFLYLVLAETSATVTLKYKTEEYETFISSTFSTADEFLKHVMETRGRKLKIRFEHVIPGEQVEIESFQGEYALVGGKA